MKFPDRLIGSVAAHASQIAGFEISEHTILLGLGFKFRAERQMSLDEVVAEFGFTRGYGRRIAAYFSITFPDFAPGNPLNLPLE